MKDAKDKYRKQLKTIINTLLEDNNMNQTDLAKLYNISQQALNEKTRKATWRYIDVAELLDKFNYSLVMKRGDKYGRNGKG